MRYWRWKTLNVPIAVIAVLLLARETRAEDKARNPAQPPACKMAKNAHSSGDAEKNSHFKSFIAFDSGLKRGKWSPAKQARLLKELGYDGIVYKHPRDMRRRMQAFHKHGLKISAISTGVDLNRESIEYPQLEKAMEKMQGSDTIIWLALDGNKGGDRKAVKILRRIGSKAKQADLKVAIYPHVNNYVETALEALRIAKKVDMENVGVSFTLCHALKAGNHDKIGEILEEVAPWLFIVQINGATKEGEDWQDENWNHLIRPLDSSEFDLAGYLGKLADIGYEGPVCLMPYGIKLPPREHLSRSMEAWKRLLRESVIMK